MKVLKESIRELFEVYASLLIRLKKCPPKRLLIIGHMRSGSSLLSHILSSNPEIVGIGETHTRYNNNNYHRKLVSAMLLKKRKIFFPHNATFIMDKILHNFILDESILEDDDTRIILLTRSPEDTIPSMLKLFKDKLLWGKPCTVKEAGAYYIERLNYLLHTHNKYGHKSFFLDYSDIVNNHEDVLKRLSFFLGLKEPLSSSYELHKYTGKKGAGDPSINVLSGRILSETEKKKDPNLQPGILQQDITKLRKLYDEVRAACYENHGSFI